MTKITKNIYSHELICKCGNCSVTILPEEPIIQIVQDVCDHFATECKVDKVILYIGRGASCYVYNRSDKIGSNDNSQHPRACAIDFKIFIGKIQVPPKLIHIYLCKKYSGSLGLGLYKSFNHADTRPNKARWSKI